MLKSFPKIYSLGTPYIQSIFDEDVEITEKIDGSQFAFGKINGEIKFRSKGAEIFENNTNKMFKIAVDNVLNMNLPDNIIFYCEYLQNPKHNILKYDRVPQNNLALFGVMHIEYKNELPIIKMENEYSSLCYWGKYLSIDVVPLIFSGKITVDKVLDLINIKSYLGGPNVEGVVVKNYKECSIVGIPHLLMAGKYVSETFKEIHHKNWKRENTSSGKWDVFKSQYSTNERWLKSVQHLKEKNKLLFELKDIGALIKAVQEDISEECKEEIKEFLWQHFGKDLLRQSTAGLPEWYKQKLALGEI